MAKTKINSAFFQEGFTLIEIIIGLGIVLILFAIILFNLRGTQQNISVSATQNSLVSDLRSQQLKTMAGSIGGSTSDDFGIHFMTDRYILFHGPSYNSSDTSNHEVMLTPGVKVLSTTLPSNTALFSKTSGELEDYTPSNNSIILKSNSEQKTMTLNRYGVVIE